MGTAAQNRRARLAKAAGNPPRVPRERAVQHRDYLRSRGMTDTRIAEKATELGHPIHKSSVSTLDRWPRIHRVTEAAILAVTPDEEPDPYWMTSPLAAQRLVQGLMYAGYPQNWISTQLGYGGINNSVHRLLKTDGRIRMATQRQIEAIADKYELIDPLTVGVRPASKKRARWYALEHQWAALCCWDPDTLGDPDAIPEWTGGCGTITGYEQHRASGHLFLYPRAYPRLNRDPSEWIESPACPACRAAYSEHQKRRRK